MKLLVNNKRAGFDYEIIEPFEAGMILFGHEAKSLKLGNGSLKGSFISLEHRKKGKDPEVFLKKCFIPLFTKAASVKDYDPERDRKLLLNKKQIAYLSGKKGEQGIALIPLKIYDKHNFVKLEFALARGKKKYDKREDIKKREVDRYAKRALKGERLD
jgi:SsrA-binding protein